MPWDKSHFFFGDERYVPPDNAESNYRMARESLLSEIQVPAGDVFRVLAENLDASKAASGYEQTLPQSFQTPPGKFPRFDLALLGMGPDGKALQEKSRLVVANWVEKFKTERITLTVPVLNNAELVMFLAGGQDKAQTLKEVLEGKQPAELYPSKLIRPVNGHLIWMVDQAAAAAPSQRC